MTFLGITNSAIFSDRKYRTSSLRGVTLRDSVSVRIQLDYGDALTTNTAQGSTVTEHIHVMPAWLHMVSAFGAYTSGSRHRKKSFIVTSDSAERTEVIGRCSLDDRREVNRSDVLDNLTRNFTRQPEKESALNLIDRAADLRRGTVQTVQRSLQPLETRDAEGLTAWRCQIVWRGVERLEAKVRIPYRFDQEARASPTHI